MLESPYSKTALSAEGRRVAEGEGHPNSPTLVDEAVSVLKGILPFC